MGKDIPIVVLGGGGVGKSCLTIQYIQGHFVQKYDPTIEDIYRKRVCIDGQQEVLMIVDTAGQEGFSSMREQYMKSGQGFMLVYSITDNESFHQLKKIYVLLRRIKGDGVVVPCIVVGNKLDAAAQRVVSSEEGAQFARQAGCPFVEVSAKNREQVERLFADLVRLVHEPSGFAAQTSAPPAAPGAQPAAAVNAPTAAAAVQPAVPTLPRKKKTCTLL